MAIATSHLLLPPLESPAVPPSSPAPLPLRTDLSCHVKHIRCSSSLLLPHSLLPFKGFSPRRRKSSTTFNAASSDGAAGTGDSEDFLTSSATVDQGKKILALQKELLDQIAERKKIVSSLKENLSNASDLLEAYKDANDAVVEPFAENLVITEESVSVNASADVSENLESTSVQLPKSEKTSVLKASPTPKVLIDKNKKTSPFAGRETTELEVAVLDDSKNAKSESQNVEGGLEDASSTTEEPVEPLAGQNMMNIIIVATECSPWVKTGGLGDVVGALPKALARRGHRVMVVVPKYSHYADATDTGVRKRYTVAGQDHDVLYFHRYIDGVDHVFLESNSFNGIANSIYGGGREDVMKRMVLLCKAAVEIPWHVPCGGVCYGDGNLVFIANDWHTALLPVYLQAYYRDNGLMQYTRSILVIHNISHQGRGPLSEFSLLGLPDHYLDKFNLYDPVGGEHMNVLMAGLITAHRIVAVSHGYAWECQTQDGGWGLDGVMRNYNWKLQGIVNGIDGQEWSPEVDVHLKSDGYSNYSIDTLQTGKAACKTALQKELGLPVRDDVPIIGFIGRLDHQKGVDIIADAMHWIRQQDVQLILLGTGRPDLEDMLRKFEGENRDKVRGWVGFSVKLAHRITAGCDILLMPSRFEPCGLNQLYAMRYGTIPVVHAVGGLRDTVQPFDPFANKGTGWTFDRADPGAMIHALGNALYTYREFKESWKAMQERGMSQDLSWDNAAKQYEEVLIAAKYQW